MPRLRGFDDVTPRFDVEGDRPSVVLRHGFAAGANLAWRQPAGPGALTCAAAILESLAEPA
jgi:hypothetical protein